MQVNSTQKTVTAFQVGLDDADVTQFITAGLLQRLNVAAGTPGVTTSVTLAATADGTIVATALVEVEVDTTPAALPANDPVLSPSAVEQPPASPVFVPGAPQPGA